MSEYEENFFREILIPLFDLKNVPLTTGTSFEQPLLYADEIDIDPSEISGFYTITDATEDLVTGVWKFSDWEQDDDGSATILTEAQIEWDPKHALIQSRKQTTHFHEENNSGFMRVWDEMEETEWASTPL